MFNSRSLLTTYLGLSIFIATSLVNAREKTVFMNLFIVEIVGDDSVAHNVASDHGFIIIKRWCSESFYAFVYEGLNRTSTSLPRGLCTGLSLDPRVLRVNQEKVLHRVLRVKQQRLLHRVERDLAINDDQEIYDEGDDVRFSDPYFENQWYLDVKNVIIWGNHSSTQFPDVANGYALQQGKKVGLEEAVKDEEWLKGGFISTVQKRGAEVIAARKLSSALSAAKAICDHLRDWWHGTKEGKWVSMGVPSDGSYRIEKGLIFSFPVTIKPGSNYTIVQGLKLSDFAKEKVAITMK